ncbi:Shedu anti-phage system protein SduA domain-containing protein [Paenarthrobacter sp. NEAU-H11]|uniref:Shedu anti-phage system protein SduA domain-containing protein n=1 Tax=Paenarthrobacter sp. NEAU-H11 TaxID=3423924 RepID=UPI003D32C896
MNSTTAAKSKLATIRAAWELVKLSEKETEAQEFLERHVALLPGAWGDIGPGGNHGPLYSTIFRQPPLEGMDAKLIPDFMWITRSTVNVTPVCIEIERPTKRWFTKDGQQTAELTQALDQLLRWKAWFSKPKNEEIFREVYLRGRFGNRELTPQFVLIYGRESDFTESHKLTTDERHAKRFSMARENEHLRTFDSLRWQKEQVGLLTTSVHANGEFEVSWMHEDFDYLGDPTGAYYLGSIEAALTANPAIDTTRAAEIRKEWKKEHDEGSRLVAGKTHRPFDF